MTRCNYSTRLDASKTRAKDQQLSNTHQCLTRKGQNAAQIYNPATQN